MGLQDKYIRFDWAIKRLLRQKANFGVLEGFLTVFLGEPIHILEILESEGNQQTEDDKFNRVDIKAKNSKGEIIIVEIQNTRELYYLERILYGVAKAITEHMKLGQSYKEVKKVYSISILYFDIGKGDDYLYIGQNRFLGAHTNDQLVINTKEKNAIVAKNPSEIFPLYVLIRVNEFNKVAVSPMEEWMEYLKTGIIDPDTSAPGLREARQKLQYHSMTDAERHAYDEHINAVMIQNDVLDAARIEGLNEGRTKGMAEGHAKGMAEGRAKGMAEGRAEGRDERSIEIARKMLAKGKTIDEIMEFTELGRECIESLKVSSINPHQKS